MTKNTTIALPIDYIDIIHTVARNVEKYELLDMAETCRALILEGCNRVYGDKAGVNYVKEMAMLKMEQRRAK